MMPTNGTVRVALYTRVSTADQEPENQRRELLAYVEARGWRLTREYCDRGISGAKDRRPALDELVADAKRRRFDVLLCWRLDRLGRSLRHLVLLLEDLDAAGVRFVTLAEGIDLGTAAGRLQLHILSALSEFERARIQERVRAGLARAKAQGRRLGRPRSTPLGDGAPKGLTVRHAATLWGCSKSVAARRLAAGEYPGPGQTSSAPA